ncbi:MAG: redoxin domain-containing protein [Dehalococcoidia bacterium]
MARNKRKGGQSWWRRRRTQRRLAVAASLALAIGIVSWLVVRGEGDSGPKNYFVEPASAFTLPTIAGDQVSLADHLGRHNVLLFFNEGMGCSPCLDQIVDLDEDWERFGALDVELVSIMVDPLSDLIAEARRRGITSIVAADEDKSVSNAYNALEFSMHPGIKPGHTFALVDKAGQIIWRWDWIGHGQPMYVEVDEIYGDVSERLERSGGEQATS